MTKTIQLWGYPHDLGNPHDQVARFRSAAAEGTGADRVVSASEVSTPQVSQVSQVQ